MHIRIPKLRGFNNPFRVEYQAINLDTITESGLDEVTPETLLAKGLVSKGALVKVLGRGELEPHGDGEGARLFRSRPRRPSPAPVARSRSCRSRSRCGRPSTAAPTPTADPVAGRSVAPPSGRSSTMGYVALERWGDGSSSVDR